jgi:hypothetical protein
MNIPPKVSIPICIEQGSVYLFNLEKKNPDGTFYKGDRFFIVLNAKPKTDEIIILVTITKKIEKQKAYVKRIGESEDTLVTITLSDFPRLSQTSIVNCNNYFENDVKDLIAKIENDGKIFRDKIPKNIIDAITGGMINSRLIPLGIKEKII